MRLNYRQRRSLILFQTTSKNSKTFLLTAFLRRICSVMMKLVKKISPKSKI